MELNLDIYRTFSTLRWFANCGQALAAEIGIPSKQVETASEAVGSMLSDSWIDAGTLAQGELTTYLARTNYELYGSNWNRLSRASREKIQFDVMPNVTRALASLRMEELVDRVLLDLNRIALFVAFSQRSSRAPDFFANLLLVYEKGHLPCGWEGDLDAWPSGTLLLF